MGDLHGASVGCLTTPVLDSDLTPVELLVQMRRGLIDVEASPQGGSLGGGCAVEDGHPAVDAGGLAALVEDGDDLDDGFPGDVGALRLDAPEA